MKLKYFLLHTVAAMSLAAPAMVRPQEPAAPAQPGVAETTEKGLAALKSNQPQQALDFFEQALRSNPNDVAATLLAATAALNLYKGDRLKAFYSRCFR
jgi:Tfp pilus assembly protein PilF